MKPNPQTEELSYSTSQKQLDEAAAIIKLDPVAYELLRRLDLQQ